MSVLTATPAPAEPYRIHCAEIWGGTAVHEDYVATPGVRAAIHSSASGDSNGGDLYYFSVCAYDTLTRIAVADVRGHGQAVNHLSQWLYESLHARMNDSNGAGVLSDLNQIVRSRGFEAITTAVVATFHRDKRVLYYAYAGHPPLLLGRQGQPWRQLEATGETKGPANLPLGVFPGARYTQEETHIEPGDRLILFSDGVSECPGPGDELYGDSRLGATLENTRALPLLEARTALRDDLTTYAGRTPLTHDDCTFLFVEPLPPVPIWRRRILPGKPLRPQAFPG